jgi:hypothetical protein
MPLHDHFDLAEVDEHLPAKFYIDLYAISRASPVEGKLFQ